MEFDVHAINALGSTNRCNRNPKKLSGVIKYGGFMEILKLMVVYSWENHGSTAGKFIAGPRVFRPWLDVDPHCGVPLNYHGPIYQNWGMYIASTLGLFNK